MSLGIFVALGHNWWYNSSISLLSLYERCLLIDIGLERPFQKAYNALSTGFKICNSTRAPMHTVRLLNLYWRNTTHTELFFPDCVQKRHVTSAFLFFCTLCVCLRTQCVEGCWKVGTRAPLWNCENKCVFNECTLRVGRSCHWQCSRTSGPSTTNLTVS